MNEDEYPLLTPNQVAKQLNIGVRTVYNMINDGILPYVEVGAGTENKRKRVKPADLATYINENSKLEGFDTTEN